MKVLVVASLLSLVTALHVDDLKRAKTKKPRSGFVGEGTLASANAKLNRHLFAMNGVNFKACEHFSVVELRQILEILHPLASEELLDVYDLSNDGRQAAYKTVAEMKQHWLQLPDGDERVRDGHCHEVVMMFVHHLSQESQRTAGRSVDLPQLPVRDHVVSARAEHDQVGKFYDSKVSCQACHKGGLDQPFPVDLGPPKSGSKDIQRRCYTNYKELYNITCGPCDGVAGKYWGDDTDKYFDPPTCVEVGKPEDVPEDERVPFAMPEMFSVEIVGGSDRWGRSTNPQMPDLAPFSTRQNHMYGQIKGHWYMRAPADEDRWLLRHDTFYGNIAWNGTWDKDQDNFYNLSQIHSQTRWQQEHNITGPMVSLNRSATWPIGSKTTKDPMCVCVPDPVGVPDISMTRKAGLAKLEYLGRMKLAPIEYLGRTVEMDHYANWFFHVFMEVNRSAPNYGKSPIRLASAYAGTAVYQNWVFDDPNVTHPGIFAADIPTTDAGEAFADSGRYCLNPTFFDACTKVKTFADDKGPATWPPMSPGHGDKCADHPGCANLAPNDGICCPNAKGERLACCDDPEHPVPGKKQHLDVVKGIFKGLMADTDAIENCEMDGMSAGEMFGAAVEDFKAGKVLDAFSDLSVAFGKIEPLVTHCKQVKTEVETLLGALKQVTPAKAKTNTEAHRTQIMQAVADASKCNDNQDYLGLGVNIGVAMRKVIEQDGLTV